MFRSGSTPSIDDFADPGIPSNPLPDMYRHPFYGDDGYSYKTMVVRVKDPYYNGDPSHTPGYISPVQFPGPGEIKGFYVVYNPYSYTRPVGTEGRSGIAAYPSIQVINESSATIVCSCWASSSGKHVLNPGQSSPIYNASYGNNRCAVIIYCALRGGGIFSLKNIKNWRVIYETYNV